MFNFFWSYQQAQSSITTIKYGALYNWYAINDSRSLCSSGWHIATRTEYITLNTYVGGTTVAGGKLKEAGTTYWQTPNTGADNAYSFNGRGSGIRSVSGSFGSISVFGNMWLSTDFSTFGYVIPLNYNSVSSATTSVQDKYYGNAVRAMRAATTEELLLSDGIIDSTYSGNDGKIYRCVKIGTQIWTADSLAETKFANGDWIHGYDSGTYTPIANATWAALTTDGMCFYNDDPTTYL